MSIPVTIYLNKAEIDSLKEFCDDNIAAGEIKITQHHKSGIGYTTTIMVKDLPETLLDITDHSTW